MAAGWPAHRGRGSGLTRAGPPSPGRAPQRRHPPELLSGLLPWNERGRGSASPFCFYRVTRSNDAWALGVQVQETLPGAPEDGNA